MQLQQHWNCRSCRRAWLPATVPQKEQPHSQGKQPGCGALPSPALDMLATFCVKDRSGLLCTRDHPRKLIELARNSSTPMTGSTLTGPWYSKAAGSSREAASVSGLA